MKKPFEYLKFYNEMNSTVFIPYSKMKTKVVSMFDGVVSDIEYDKKLKMTTEHDINDFEFDIVYTSNSEDEYSQPEVKVDKNKEVKEGQTLFIMKPDVELEAQFIVGFTKYNYEEFISRYGSKIETKKEESKNNSKDTKNNPDTPLSLNSFFDDLLLKPILNPLSGKKPIEESLEEDILRFKKLI
jgi:hypothetical protein